MLNSPNSETPIRTTFDLGREIRLRRKAQKMRIDDAAALCGVSVGLLSRLENGHSGVSSERLLKVLQGLGLELLVVPSERLAEFPRRRSTP